MEVGLGRTLLAGDPRLIDHIVGEVKSQGIFDQFRKECIADVDTKPAYQNLRTRVESSVNTFLGKQIWKPDMNKNQLRENLRKHIHDAAYLDAGVERIVDQVVHPKVYSVFMPQIEDVVYKFLGMERPKNKDRNGATCLKDLLPKDLDPVSPESDKNSLKDDSLESVDSNLGVIVGINSRLLSKDTSTVETKSENTENIKDKPLNDNNAANKHSESLENQLESNSKNSSKNISASNLNISSKSDEKTEEEEEDSPVFEPIDIMNFNESNDSHLSGISELTSHRSRSPDFINDFSRDNLDFSNHDSQLSKASSDSRLSIVTDFGLSNHAPTPMPETLKDDSNKGKSIDTSDPKGSKDNFKAIRDIESNKANVKESKNSFETIRGKDNQSHESKDSKDLKNVKGTPDSTEGGTKNKTDSKDTCKENDSSKTKSSKEKSDIKESKSYKDRDKDHKRRQSGHSNSSKHDKSDKYSRDKYKDKSEKSRDSYEKGKEHQEKSKEADKTREDKKDPDKKDSVGKDLKDIYKEKIRELREKKELTEKEKSAKDPKEAKPTKESRDKKDSSKDRKDSKSSSSKGSSRYDEKLNSKSDSKSSSKGFESKDSKYDIKDKGKRDDKRQSKDAKDSRNKSHSSAKADTTEKNDKSESKKDPQPRELGERIERSDAKRDVKSESQKSEAKKDSKTESQNKDCDKIDKLESKKDTKIDSQGKERKKKDEKKTKVKDDHSSLRKNPNDRRSTDRDGSNGSNGKSSQKNSSSSITNASKTGSTTLNKESSGTSNSSSETSDNMDISPSDEIKSPLESGYKDNDSGNKDEHLSMKTADENESEIEYFVESDLMPKRVDLGQNELSLPLKKRPLQSDVTAPNPSDFKVKKPKFAKNFQEAKRLMKIRKKLEKQRLKEYEAAKMKFQMANHVNDSNQSGPMSMVVKEQTVPTLPDEERVQIIEVTDDEYEEPYPDLSMKEMNISLDQQSINSLENPLVLNNSLGKLENVLEKQSSLSVMEQSIRQGLEDMISDKKLIESESSVKDTDDSTAKVTPAQSEVDDGEKLSTPDTTTNNLKRSDYNVNNPIPSPHEKKTNMEKESSKNLNSQEKGLRKVEPLKICKEKESNQRSKTLSASVTSQCIKKPPTNEISPLPLDDNDNCLYFEADNERAEKFSKFLESLELEVDEDESHPQNFSSESLERILESLGGRIVSALPKTMAPPMAKRKHSTSPLTDILLNNSYNNNNRHKAKESSPEEELNTSKKRRLGRPKKQQAIANVCAIPSLPNGENFVMPLSPESDVSASSEKTSLHLPKEDKSRQRSSQRYSSDDLYKPRPFFSSSSRRSRRSNQA